MYAKFEVQNFRGFPELHFAPLSLVNLIAGANNAGKTALLEAIFLHVGVNNPELPFRVNVIRGIEHFNIQPAELWGWLFFNKQTDHPIKMISVDDKQTTRTITIALSEPRSVQIPTKENRDGRAGTSGYMTAGDERKDLLMSYTDSHDKSTEIRVWITPEGELKYTRTSSVLVPIGIYLSTRSRFSGEDAERYSNLERVGRHESILPILQVLEPRLSRLAVLVTGRVPLISGDIGVGELIPLPLMGEGLVRLVSILLAIANAPGGIVLIDEIENGLHHSVMTKVFEAIAIAARSNDVQVFATTHSMECIRSAHEAFAQSGSYDLVLHRLERIDGVIQDIAYDLEAMDAAVKAEIEVR